MFNNITISSRFLLKIYHDYQLRIGQKNLSGSHSNLSFLFQKVLSRIEEHPQISVSANTQNSLLSPSQDFQKLVRKCFLNSLPQGNQPPTNNPHLCLLQRPEASLKYFLI